MAGYSPTRPFSNIARIHAGLYSLPLAIHDPRQALPYPSHPCGGRRLFFTGVLPMS